MLLFFILFYLLLFYFFLFIFSFFRNALKHESDKVKVLESSKKLNEKLREDAIARNILMEKKLREEMKSHTAEIEQLKKEKTENPIDVSKDKIKEKEQKNSSRGQSKSPRRRNQAKDIEPKE